MCRPERSSTRHDDYHDDDRSDDINQHDIINTWLEHVDTILFDNDNHHNGRSDDDGPRDHHEHDVDNHDCGTDNDHDDVAINNLDYDDDDPSAAAADEPNIPDRQRGVGGMSRWSAIHCLSLPRIT